MASISVFDDLPLGRLNPVTNSSIGTLETVTGLTATHKQLGVSVRTTLTLASVAIPVVNGTEYQYKKLWTFPQGRILLLNAELSMAQTTTSILADTLNSGSTGAMSVGSAAASNVALTSTMADMIASTAFTSSTTINVAGTAVTAVLDSNRDASELVNFDGTSTPIPVYFNNAYATTTDVDADATQTFSGTIVLYWVYLGGTVNFS